jgi:hypothetical protein
VKAALAGAKQPNPDRLPDDGGSTDPTRETKTSSVHAHEVPGEHELPGQRVQYTCVQPNGKSYTAIEVQLDRRHEDRLGRRQGRRDVPDSERARRNRNRDRDAELELHGRARRREARVDDYRVHLWRLCGLERSAEHRRAVLADRQVVDLVRQLSA